MLETARLKLVPLTHEQLLLYKNDPEALSKNLKIDYLERENDPKTKADHEEAIDFWLNGTLQHREHFEWFTTWEIILKSENVSIGGIGFAGLPNEKGESMVGYGLDLRFHNKGYATEALSALLKWGFDHPQLTAAIADCHLDNVPSHRVLIKNGFTEMSRDELLIHWLLNR